MSTMEAQRWRSPEARSRSGSLGGVGQYSVHPAGRFHSAKQRSGAAAAGVANVMVVNSLAVATKPDADRETAFVALAEKSRRQNVKDVLSVVHEEHRLPWNAIASAVGVSRHAIRKWRNEEAQPTRDRRRRLDRLAAFCHVLRDMDAEASQWLSAELDELDGASSGLKVLDVLAVDAHEFALRHFIGELSDHSLLADLFPNRASEPGLLQTHWQLDTDEHETASFVVVLPALGLVSSGTSRKDVEEDLSAQVSDYTEDWFSELRHSEPHRSRREAVLAAADALDDGRLQEALFGA